MPKKLHDCVSKVKAKPNVKNPWAVCNSALYQKKPKGKK